MEKKESKKKAKAEYESKFHRVTVRFDKKKEWKTVQDYARENQIEVQPYVKSCALNKKTFIQKIPEANQKLIYELNKIGVNFNQLVKHLKEGKYSNDEAYREFKDFHELINSTIKNYK